MILVLGPGGSGTSSVARVLHERLGVSMGKKFTDAEHYEDAFFVWQNLALLEGKTSLAKWQRDVNVYVRVECEEPWGFKCSRSYATVPLFKAMFPNARTIRTKRPMEKVIASFVRLNRELIEANNGTYEQVREEIRKREFLLDNAIGDGDATVYFPAEGRLSDEEIEDTIRPVVLKNKGIELAV